MSAGTVGIGAGTGEAMHAMARELFPICRSITGEGLRETLRRISARIPLEMQEVASGSVAFDWTVPKEWNIRQAWIKDPAGNTVVDFRDHSLHVLNYSVPIHRKMSLAELRPHLHTLPGNPDWIPYRTSYYQEQWGFCLTHRRLQSLPEGEYEVCIDSTLEAGSLSYGELFLPGESADEILFSTHVCHPSLANDNLSGIVVATELAQTLAAAPRRHSFRFLFLPGTIGSITWLSRNEAGARRIKYGLVLAGLGDAGGLTYKRSQRGDTVIDRAAAHVLASTGPHLLRDFHPYGYDERQFCSPGFNLAVGRLSRTPFGEYPEYHTSGDDLAFVKPAQLEGALRACLEIVDILEHDSRFVNLNPNCEPQLGKRGLYGATGGPHDRAAVETALLWVLNQSDGENSLLDIARRSGLAFAAVLKAKELLQEKGLLAPAGTRKEP